MSTICCHRRQLFLSSAQQNKPLVPGTPIAVQQIETIRKATAQGRTDLYQHIQAFEKLHTCFI